MCEKLSLNLYNKLISKFPQSSSVGRHRLQKIINIEVQQFLDTNNLTDKTLRQLELQIYHIVE
jgi:hypothetical protein